MGVSWGPSPSPLATFSLRRPLGAATAPRRGSYARAARRGAQLSWADAARREAAGLAVVRRLATSARSFWPALTGTRTQPTELVESEDARMPTHCEAAGTGRPADRTQNDPAPSPAAGVTT